MIHREISDKKYQIDCLDGLRGFAALIVVVSHASNSDMFFIPFLDLSGNGKSGVFLFFLLSSFLLTLNLLRKGKEVFSWPVMSHYLQRRFLRIYPLYIFYLLFCVISPLLVTTVLGNSAVNNPFALDWAEFVNHLTLQEGRGVTWSIIVEFKFYFTLPLFVLVILFFRAYGPVANIVFFAFLMLLSQLISPQSESLVHDTRLLPYMPIFIIGMFLALVQDYINNNKPNKVINFICKYGGYLGVAGVTVMTPSVFSLFGDRVERNYFHREFILFAIFWSFVILSSVNSQGLLQRLFTMKVLRFYGAISFGFYLFHPVFIVALHQVGLNGFLSAWLVILGATVTAYLSFKLLEGPVSRYRLTRSNSSRAPHAS